MNKILSLLSEKNNIFCSDLDIEKYVYDVSNRKIQQNEIIEIMKLIDIEKIDTLVCNAVQINIASRILWQSKYIKRYILTDTDNPLLIEKRNKKVEARMWDLIAVRGGKKNQIEQSGWISSFTGDFFTQEEIEEYKKNIAIKLSTYITETSNVLEIGIASGLTCCAIAPQVKTYIGIDLSSEILKRTEETLANKEITNVRLECADAMDIDKLQTEGQDIIILNSVLQYFPGYNYLIILLNKILKCIKSQAIIYLGDLIDTDLVEKFMKDLNQYGKKKNNKDDLSYPKEFIKELPAYIPEIVKVKITSKLGTIENELKKYRYDVILLIDKDNKHIVKHTKFQYAMQSKGFSITDILENDII